MISILFTIISHLRAPASPLKEVTKKFLGGGIGPLRIDTDPLGIELTPIRLESDPFLCLIRNPEGLISYLRGLI
jgi:hypothetical protein